IQDYDRALALRPQETEIMLWKAKALYMLGQSGESSSLLRSIIEIDPSDEGVSEWGSWYAQVLVARGAEVLKQNKNTEALAIFDSALALHPAHASAFYYLSFVNFNLGHQQEALRDAKLAIAYDPHNLEHYLRLDWLESRHFEWDTIITYWSR